jgi:hypothetical protein
VQVAVGLWAPWNRGPAAEFYFFGNFGVKHGITKIYNVG